MTSTMYPGLQHLHISEGGDGVKGDSDSNKVDRVCAAVRKTLDELGSNKYLLSIITTYIKMTDPQLETVLGMIKQLKGKECVYSKWGEEKIL